MILAAITDELLKEQRLSAIMLLWSVIGVVLLALLWPKGRGRKLARQTFALAVLGFREGIRLKILWTVAVLAVITVMLAYFSDADGTHAGRAQLILNISLACGEILGAGLIVLLSALSVAREIESRIMHTLGTKPMPRWSILLGKALGFWAIDLLFAAGLLLFTAALVRAVRASASRSSDARRTTVARSSPCLTQWLRSVQRGIASGRAPQSCLPPMLAHEQVHLRRNAVAGSVVCHRMIRTASMARNVWRPFTAWASMPDATGSLAP